jgi:hypothetical protein
LECAIALQREAAAVVVIAASLPEPGTILRREQAVCAGLLMRAAAWMRAVGAIAKVPGLRGVLQGLNRCIQESVVTSRFLQVGEPDQVERFVRESLGPERELYDLIHANIAAHGGIRAPIEDRMLRSIEKTSADAGVDIQDVGAKAHWATNFRLRCERVERPEIYIQFRLGSHAIHGTWVDLQRHHIEKVDGGWEVRHTPEAADVRLLLPPSLLALEGAGSYAETWIGSSQDARVVLERILELIARVQAVDADDERLLTTSTLRE